MTRHILTLTAILVASTVYASPPQSIIVWNQSIGTERTDPDALVSTLFAADPEHTTFNFLLVSGPGDDDNASFSVTANELLTNGPLPEGDYSIRLRATNPGDLSVEETFTITVVPGSVEPKIAAGAAHSVMLSLDGTVLTSGWGSYGMLGHGDTENRLAPTPIEHENLFNRTIVDVAAGHSHTVLLSADGTVFTFGSGSTGKLGHDDTENRLVPTPIEHENLAGHTIVDIAAGSQHTVLLSSDGTVFTFGSVSGGRLGHGNTPIWELGLGPNPIEHENLFSHTITRIAAGGSHTILLSDEGAVFSFGHGFAGKLGHGDTDNRNIPVRIEHANLADHNLIDISAGGQHSLLLSSDGTVFSFGSGEHGRLGHGDTSNRLVPTPIEHVHLDGHTIVEAAAGGPHGSHTVLRSANGTVFTFGEGDRGRLGHGDEMNRLVPTVVDHPTLHEHFITGIAAGSNHTILLSSDGMVITFGNNSGGGLGHNDTEDRLVPERIENFSLLDLRILRLDVAGKGFGSLRLNGNLISEFPYVFVAGRHSEILLEAVPAEGAFFERWRGDLKGPDLSQLVVLDTDKTIEALFEVPSLFVWNQKVGTERTGEGTLVSKLFVNGPEGFYSFALTSGEGDNDNASFSVAGNQLQTNAPLPEGEYSIRLRATDQSGLSAEETFTITVVSGSVEPKVAAGGAYTVLLSSDGTVFTFGWSYGGGLGHGDSEGRRVPIPIEHENLSEHTIVDVAASSHTVMLAADGTVFTFGLSNHGQLGHGDTEARLVPTPIEHENLSGHTIARIAVGNSHTVLLSADGTVFTFGSGLEGQLGHGDTENRHVPTAIEHESLSGHAIIGIAGGASHTALLSSNGTVFTFGSGNRGQLGHGDTENRLVPAVIENESLSGHTIADIATGSQHTVLLSLDGIVFSFGDGRSGRLGHGDTQDRTVPTPLDHENLSGRTIVEIAAGGEHTALVSTDGAVLTFGRGSHGRLGHGDTENRLAPTPIDHENIFGHTITGVSLGSSHACLLSSDGTVFTFGANAFVADDTTAGRLGHGDAEDRLVPTPIEFFGQPGFQVFLLDLLGGGSGTFSINGEPVSEFPFVTNAEEGAELFIDAIPDEDSFFERWYGDLDGTAASQIVSVDKYTHVTATFGGHAIVLWNKTIGETRTGGGAPVSPLHAPGPEGDPFTFSLASGNGDDHNPSFNVVGNQLQTTEVLPHGEYLIRLRATSESGVSVEESFSISVVPGSGAPKVAAGGSHSVGLASDGTVLTFGMGLYGQLGHGDSEDRDSPVPIEHDNLSGQTITDIAAAGGHTVMLSSDGTVYTFGSGYYGQLGHGDTEDRMVPTAIDHENLAGYTITGIAAGSRYTVLLASDGTVFTFGTLGFGFWFPPPTMVPTRIEHRNLSGHTITGVAAGSEHTVLISAEGKVFTFGEGGGRLGHGDTQGRLVPTQIKHENLSGHTIVEAAAGHQHTVLLSSDGTVFTFGRGTSGQLGHGDMSARSLPTPIEHENIADHSITGIAARSDHTILLATDGTVFTFGSGYSGQLGHASTVAWSGSPIPPDHLLIPTPLEDENLAGHTISGITTGWVHTMLLSSNGSVLTFGGGDNGQLGHGDNETRLVPNKIHDFNLAGNRTLMLDTVGTGSGSLILNGEELTTMPYYFAAAKGTELTLEAAADDGAFFDKWLGGLSGIDHSKTFVLDTDKSASGLFGVRSIVLWNRTIGTEHTGSGALVSTLHVNGPQDDSYTFALVAGEGDADNASFIISGNELQTTASLPVGEYHIRLLTTSQSGFSQEDRYTISVVPGKVAPRISAGTAHTVALASDGSVFTFGFGGSGRLGHGDTEIRMVPTPVEHEALDSETIIDVSAGDRHTVLLSKDGTVFSFGRGRNGQLGHGDIEDRLFPTPIEHPNLSGHSIAEIGTGGHFTVLVSTDGTVFSFGAGSAGQLGHGDTEDRLVPVPIDHDNLSGHSVVQVAPGLEHTVLLTADGSVFTFGRGANGELGYGGFDNLSVPQRINHANLDGRTITAVSAGTYYTLLLASDGTVFSFGSGGNGRLGHGDTEGRGVPTPIEHDNLAGHVITHISGITHSVLLSSDGTVFTFGEGSSGQLGHGDTNFLTVPTPVEYQNLAEYTITGINAGRGFTVLESNCGTVLTFGVGVEGRLGHGDSERRLVPTRIGDFNLLGTRRLTLDIAGRGQGSFLLNGEPVTDLPHLLVAERGSEIFLEAVPDEQSSFDKWLGDANGTDPSHSLFLDRDMTIGASFGKDFIFIWNKTIGTARTAESSLVSTLFVPGFDLDAIDFALVSGTSDDDNEKFKIAGDQLQTAESLPVGDYSIRLAATHHGAALVEEAFTISVVPGTVEPKMALGGDHSLMLAHDGTVFSFGSGSSGQLGQGDLEERLVPTPIENEILSGHTITEIAAGMWHSVLLASDGTVFTFGSGSFGNLGHGDTGDRLVPTPIEHENLTGHTIAGIAAGDRHTILHSYDGSVLTFGSGDSGRLGHGDTEDRLAPTLIENEALAGQAITNVAAGGEHTVLLSANGTVFTFGAGSSGQLGHGDTQERLLPTAIEDESLSWHTITSLTAGSTHTALLSSNGRVLTFGEGRNGRLGHGDRHDQLLPKVIEHENLRGIKITGLAAGREYTVLVSSDGTVFTFGRATSGALGHGSTTSLNFPVPIKHENLTGHRVIDVAAGSVHTALLSLHGTVFTFGSGSQGRLGHGEDTSNRSVPTPIYGYHLLPITPERERFNTAMAEAGLSGVHAEPTSAPFGDGVENLLKFAFNMDPSRQDLRFLTPNGGEMSGLPVTYYEDNESEPLLVIEFVRHRNSDLIYAPKTSTDLTNWQPVSVTPEIIEIHSEWERVRLEIDLTPFPAQAFGKVLIIMP